MLVRNEKEQYIFKKSYEIAYALFRIGAKVEIKSFSEKLYFFSAEIIDAGVTNDYRKLTHALGAAEGLVAFGSDVSIVGSANAELLLGEVRDLSLAVADWRSEEMKTTELDLASVFSVGKPPFADASQVDKNSDSGSNPNADIRQTAILDKIRQIGNCRLKDIQEILPEYSERTIRYDIQSLLGQNLIERIGNAGPSVYYRIRQNA